MAVSRIMQIEAMYQSHGPALLRYLQRTFGSCASAEDLLHETFLRVLARDDQCQAAVSPRAFLFGIARHVGLTAVRRAKLARTQVIGEIEAKAPATHNAALEEMQAAIERLPEQIRETLGFRLRDELSYEEIAAALEIPVGTVRSRLHTAIRLLRDELI
ncbi:MAG: RNA polymerase sigma factor [Thermoguttaceae bacterium]